MKVMENKFFKAINFEAVFDNHLDECDKKIDCIEPLKVDGVKYGVEIIGNLLTGLTKVEVFGIEDGETIDIKIDHETILKWANIELDKYLESNKDAIMAAFPYQFKPEPTDGIRIL